MKKVYLYPGEMAAFKEPAELTTILGSCVAVAMFDAQALVAGLNHYLLAHAPEGEQRRTTRYGDVAIPALYEELKLLGATQKNLRAKVFGGGNVMNEFSTGERVGEGNIALARTELSRLGVPIVQESVGGKQGRKILFSTSTFDVEETLMKRAGVPEGGEPHRVRQDSAQPSLPILMMVGKSFRNDPLIEAVFLREGIQVRAVIANLFEAVSFISSLKPDIVLVDLEIIQQPAGSQFVEKLVKHIPLVALALAPEQAGAESGGLPAVEKPSADPAALSRQAQNLVKALSAERARRTKPGTGRRAI